MARCLLSPVRLRLDVWRFQRQVRASPERNTIEGKLFGLYTEADTFSFPANGNTRLSDAKSLYGSHSDRWYLPDFSARGHRYATQTTRHALGQTILHVEAMPSGGEISAAFCKGRLLAYPYMVPPHPLRDRYAVSLRKNVRFIECGVCLLAFTSGYYHWLVEGLPRVLDVLDDGIDLNRYPLILPPLETYQREVLEMLGVDVERQVVSVGIGDWCHVQDCVFPTAYFPLGEAEIEDPSGQPNREMLLLIRERVLAKLPHREVTTPRRLHISRARAAKRKFTAATETALAGMLARAGFVTIYLEDMPWPEQVRLLSGAEYVAGFHGAGLTNILFGQLKGLLEFHNPMEARAYFAVIARELGIQYHFVVGALEGTSANFDNITLCLDEARQALERMLG